VIDPPALRDYSAIELAALFARLGPATALPVGNFTGEAWSYDVRGIAIANRIWQGKEFRDDWVVNRILGMQRVIGHVTLEGGMVVIRYARYGLTDYLKPLTKRRSSGVFVQWKGDDWQPIPPNAFRNAGFYEATSWLGRMPFRGGTVWFTLEQQR
jgi:hypothetical protein